MSVNVPTTVNIDTAVALYYSKTEITTRDICAIFGCCKTTGNLLKKQARAAQINEGVPFYNARAVNVETAFRAWGLDIKRLERAQKHPKLRLGAEG